MGLTAELEIKNKKGLHARAAAAFVKVAEQFNATIEVERLGQTVNGCSIMGLMMLAAAQGTMITIRAHGDEAQIALAELTALINNRFGEE